MGDRSAITVMFARIPDDRRGEIADVLGDCHWDFTSTMPGVDPTALVVGEELIAPEESLGRDDEIVAGLATIDGVVAAVWQDPKYEYAGSVHYVVTSMEPRFWSGSGDAEGNVTLTGRELDEMVAEFRRNADGENAGMMMDAAIVLCESIERMTGAAYRRAYEAARPNVEADRG